MQRAAEGHRDPSQQFRVLGNNGTVPRGRRAPGSSTIEMDKFPSFPECNTGVTTKGHHCHHHPTLPVIVVRQNVFWVGVTVRHSPSSVAQCASRPHREGKAHLSTFHVAQAIIFRSGKAVSKKIKSVKNRLRGSQKHLFPWNESFF